MREADAQCVARARVFVDQDEALAKAGDLLQAMAEHAFERIALQGTLEQLCRGRRNGRADASEITLFKSVGSAWQDLAAAGLVVDAAMR
jgi:ornithine cyclodeaminase